MIRETRHHVQPRLLQGYISLVSILIAIVDDGGKQMRQSLEKGTVYFACVVLHYIQLTLVQLLILPTEGKQTLLIKGPKHHLQYSA